MRRSQILWCDVIHMSCRMDTFELVSLCFVLCCRLVVGIHSPGIWTSEGKGRSSWSTALARDEGSEWRVRRQVHHPVYTHANRTRVIWDQALKVKALSHQSTRESTASAARKCLVLPLANVLLEFFTKYFYGAKRLPVSSPHDNAKGWRCWWRPYFLSEEEINTEGAEKQSNSVWSFCSWNNVEAKNQWTILICRIGVEFNQCLRIPSFQKFPRSNWMFDFRFETKQTQFNFHSLEIKSLIQYEDGKTCS